MHALLLMLAMSLPPLDAPGSADHAPAPPQLGHDRLLPAALVELQVAYRWFVDQVAEPVLSAPTPDAARRMLASAPVAERAMIARGRIAHATRDALDLDAQGVPAEEALAGLFLQVEDVLAAHLDRAGMSATAFSDALTDEHALASASLRLLREQPELLTSAAFVQDCLRVEAVSAHADVLLAVVLHGLTRPDAPPPAVLTALCQDAVRAAAEHVDAVEGILAAHAPDAVRLTRGWTHAREAAPFTSDEAADMLVLADTTVSEDELRDSGLLAALRRSG